MARPYSRSRPELTFTLDAFAAGLRGFGNPARTAGKGFDLLVVSACNGGTPAVIQALTPFADWVLASPGELHLSYLDSRALIPILRNGAGGSAEACGRAIAAESFARLCETTATAVTVALYASAKSAGYLDAHRAGWETLGPAESASPAGSGAQGTRWKDSGYGDCARNPGFGPGGAESGAASLYRAPLFGPRKAEAFTSGWECARY